MPPETTETTTAAPVATAEPAAPITAPVTAPPAKGELPKVGEPGWLNARTDRAKEAGAKEAKRALKEERKAVKAAAQEAKVTVENAKAEVAAAKLAVDAILSDVPAAEREALIKAGGGNITETLKAFSVWKVAKGTAAAAPKVETQAVEKPATEVAAPVTTAALGNAPAAPTNPTTPEDYRATYANLKASNPYLAAEFLVNNPESVFPNLALKK